MTSRGWQGFLGTVQSLSDALAGQIFAPRQLKAPLLRAGTNVTVLQELGGLVISATGGGGAAGDSDQTLLPVGNFGQRPAPAGQVRAGANLTLTRDLQGVTLSAPGVVAPENDQSLLPGRLYNRPSAIPAGLAGGGLVGTYPNPEVLPERLLGGLLPYLPRQAKPPDLRAGSNITITRDAAGVTIASTGGGGSASLTAVTLNAPYDVQEWAETIADAAVSPTSKIQVSWGAPSSADENEPSMDCLTFSAVPGSGTLTITASSEGCFGGPLKLHYLVA